MVPSNSPVSEGMYGILKLGMLFGIFPLKVCREKGRLRYSSGTFSLIYSTYNLLANFVIFTFAVIIFVRELGFPDTNFVEQFLDLVFHCHTLLTLIICIYQSRRLPEVLEVWNEVESLLKTYEKIDQISLVLSPLPDPQVKYGTEELAWICWDDKSIHRRFIRCTKLISGTYLTICLIGAVSYFTSIQAKENYPTFQAYLDNVSQVYVVKELCFWWTGIYILILGHVQEVIWAYGDILILSISYNLMYEFRRFNKIVRRVSTQVPSPLQLEHLRTLHFSLSKATNKWTEMVSSLTTVTFLSNILYLFSRVYNGLEEDLRIPHLLVNFEAIYALIYLVSRIFLTAIIATQFSEESTKSAKILASTHFYSQSDLHHLIIDRFIGQVLSTDVGISGNGYFRVDQGFVGRLMSGIITYEVIILQFSLAAKKMEDVGGFMNRTGSANNSTLTYYPPHP